MGGPGPEQIVALGSAWIEWLEHSNTTAFRFQGPGARFTARRELQRGHWYWYAYRRRGGSCTKRISAARAI
jgi:hypothetical protein